MSSTLISLIGIGLMLSIFVILYIIEIKEGK